MYGAEVTIYNVDVSTLDSDQLFSPMVNIYSKIFMAGMYFTQLHFYHHLQKELGKTHK